MGYKLVLVTDHPSAWGKDGWIETNEWILVADGKEGVEKVLSPVFVVILLHHANRNWDGTPKYVKTDGGGTDHTGEVSNRPQTKPQSDLGASLDRPDCLGPTVKVRECPRCFQFINQCTCDQWAGYRE